MPSRTITDGMGCLSELDSLVGVVVMSVVDAREGAVQRRSLDVVQAKGT